RQCGCLCGGAGVIIRWRCWARVRVISAFIFVCERERRCGWQWSYERSGAGQGPTRPDTPQVSAPSAPV
ncbi:hypothetical protein OC842_007364, partial [Tilletia horrida]